MTHDDPLTIGKGKRRCLRTDLHVALVYNVKKEDETGVPAVTETEAHKPRRNNGDVATLSRPALTGDDTYAEWDTIETIHAVESALKQQNRVSLIEANDRIFTRLVELRPDIVFNIAEGLRGPSREAQVPAMLEFLGIPYTGSDPLTLAVCLDKARAKEILSYHSIPTPSFLVVENPDEVSSLSFSLPAIVKPLHEGSSKGVFDASVVRTQDELRSQVQRVLGTYHEPALVEQFLTGREFTVAMLGNGKSVRVLPLLETRFDRLPPGANHIYSYEAKWLWDTLDDPLDIHECPANVTPELAASIEDVCRRTFNVLKCRDWTRIDVRLDDQDIPHIIELNPLPGILPNPEEHSAFPQAARAAGIEYNTMLNLVLETAVQRYGLQ